MGRCSGFDGGDADASAGVVVLAGVGSVGGSCVVVIVVVVAGAALAAAAAVVVAVVVALVVAVADDGVDDAERRPLG